MEKQKMESAEVDKKINELKIEMLKQNLKRKGIKREIARALTMKKSQSKTNQLPKVKEETTKLKNQNKTETKSGGNK